MRIAFVSRDEIRNHLNVSIALQWPADHLGPVSTYMTSCDGDCESFDASSAQWFKVDASGYSDGEWASAQLIANGNKWYSTIPSELKPGQYVRNSHSRSSSRADKTTPQLMRNEMYDGLMSMLGMNVH